MGTSALYTWLSEDRAEERGSELDEAHDESLGAETRRQAAAIRTNCLIGHEQTLASIANGVSCRIGDDNGILEQLVRAALTCGPLTAGQIMLDLITKEIEADAEAAALKELEWDERSSGLDFSAMVCADPGLMVPA